MTIENQNNIDKSSVDSKANNLINSYNEKTENTVIYQGRYSDVLKGIVSKEDLNKDQLNQIYGILELLESSENITVTEGYITQLEQILKNKSAETVEVSAQTKQSILEDLPDLSGGNGVLSDIPVVGGALDGVPEAFNEAYENAVGKGISSEEEQIKKTGIEASELVLSMLEDNEGTIDYGFSKIETLIKEAENLNESELSDEIKSLDIFFDIEPEDWDKYFKDNNIPEDKQLEFKRFFTELTGKNQDGGNLFFKDFGKQINEEVERIMLLSADESKEITISIDYINPGEELKFDNKRDALLYLYYNKLLLREVGTSIYDVIIGAKNTSSFISNIPEFISNHPTELIGTLGALVSYSLFTISYRHFNKFLLKNTWNGGENFLTFGKLLDEGGSGNINANNEEVRELEKRQEKINELRKVYGNDPKMEKLIKDAEKWIFIADGTSTNKREGSIFKIISRAGFPESTFWRKVTYIENGGIWYNKYSDLFKPILLNTEYGGSKKTEIINKVRSEIFDSNGEVKKGTYFDNLRRYIAFSHKIDDSMENNLKNIVEDYEKRLRDGNFLKLIGKTKNQTENNIRQAIYDDLKRIYPTISTDLFKENGFTNFADDFRNINEFRQNFINNISAQGVTINNNVKNKLESFFDDCKSGRKTFDRGAAIDIMLRILNGDEIDVAIRESREHLTQENINSLNDKNKGLSEIVKSKYGSYDFGVSIDRKREKIYINFDEIYRRNKASILNSNKLADIEKKNLLKEVDELYRAGKTIIGEIDETNIVNKFNELKTKIQDFNNSLPKDGTGASKVSMISNLEDADKIISNPPKKRKRDTIKSVGDKIIDTGIKSKNVVGNSKEKVSEYFVDENKVKLKNRALASLEISSFPDAEKLEKMKKILKFDKKFSDYETKINSLFDSSNPLKSESEIKAYLDTKKSNIISLKRFGVEIDETTYKIKKDIGNLKNLNAEDISVLKILRFISKGF